MPEDVVGGIPVIVLVNLDRPVPVSGGDVFDRVVRTRTQLNADARCARSRPRHVETRYLRVVHAGHKHGCAWYPRKVSTGKAQPSHGAKSNAVGTIAHIVVQELIASSPAV